MASMFSTRPGRKPKLIGFLIGMLALFISLSFYFLGAELLDVLELKTLDLRFRIRGPISPGNPIAIAAIDQKSIDRLGRWPWPRSTIGTLLETLKERGALAIGMDVVFASPDNNPALTQARTLIDEFDRTGLGETAGKGPEFRDTLEKALAESDTDAAFAESISKVGNVVLGYFFFLSPDEIEHVTPEEKERDREALSITTGPFIKRLSKNVDESGIPVAFGVKPNIMKLSSRANSSGFVNFALDIDGVIRWAPLIIRYGPSYHLSLDVEVIGEYLGIPATQTAVYLADYGVAGIAMGPGTIPTDEGGKILINYRGPARTFPYYSISDILSGDVGKEELGGRIVLVGATATGLTDVRLTPFSGKSWICFPGVEVHANAIDTILAGDAISRPDWFYLIDLVSMLFIGLTLAMVLPRVKAVQGFAFTAVLLAGYLSVVQLAFTKFGMWLNSTCPSLLIIMSYLFITTYRFMTEYKHKNMIKNAFKFYLSPQVVEEVVKDASTLRLGGEKKELTVLFSDIKGFTSLSEQVEPHLLISILNEYLTGMTEIIFRHNGTLDKFVGDMVMAIWGAPVDQDDHAAMACRAALDMQAALKALREKWNKEGRPMIKARIGINSGEMIVGNMGSKTRFDYTVIGDNVNLGSRLEDINKLYGTGIVVSESTRDLAGGEFVFRELDTVRVKGKKKAIRIYELMDSTAWAGETGLLPGAWDKALALYREQRWDEAMDSFREFLKMNEKDGPSLAYIGRIEQLKKTGVPEKWDGVMTL
ncbi:MAG: adenylate/guanylate cyclase domain-containing protein [Candidatus Tritonobacter lacicola]|nr:adenylate/guanylate cyclase domain-containing protein [Candidatus Tritonobacter lacicola]